MRSGQAMGAACTSIGISTLTGPIGGVSAVRAASRSTPNASPGDQMRKNAFDTAFSMSGCRGASWI